jgi:MFS family permease
MPLSVSLNISVRDLNAGTGYLFLLAGYGLLFWQPFALQYGKRPAYLLSTLGMLGMTIWSPYTKGNGQWIAKNILGGFFAAPIEALPELSVTDVYFAHQRGAYMALYAFALVGSNFPAPTMCGWINDGQGYK